MEVNYMEPEHLSDILKKMYDFIIEYIQDNGMPPTNREIGSAMNIASTGHVDYHLSMLEKEGYITRESKKSRGIRLVQQPFAIPVLGTIAAGEPLDIHPYPSVSLHVGQDLMQQGAYALVVNGQSMIEDNIGDKDYVVIKPQSTCEKGDIIVAVHLQGSGQATLKRFFQDYDLDRVMLLPSNSQMEPIYIPKSVWDRDWQVQGKVLAIFRKSDSNRDTIFRILDEGQPNTKNNTKIDQMEHENQEVITPRRLRVFLCHSSGDKLSVRKLYQRLNACNVDPWLDEEDLLAGQDWEYEIGKAVRETDVVIVCLSCGSINKTGFMQKEIKFALDVADKQAEGTIFLIPLKLEECEMPERLRRWHWVNYFEENGFDKLIKTLKYRGESSIVKLAPVNDFRKVIEELSTKPAPVISGAAQENVKDLFDMFTKGARKVLSLAQDEAQRFQHNYIGTEHLLLGLVRERQGVAAKVLSNLGVELNKVRSTVEFIIGRGDRIVLGEIGLNPRAKKVIELAVAEARRLNHHYIGTEHLLLGLVRQGEGGGVDVLESLGINLEKVRTQTINAITIP
jgi:repressor LexA